MQRLRLRLPFARRSDVADAIASETAATRTAAASVIAFACLVILALFVGGLALPPRRR